MKKLLLKGFLDFLEKFEEINSGKLKIAKIDRVMNNLLGGEGPDETLSVYLIPTDTEMIIMVFSGPVISALLAYIEKSDPYVICYIQVANINKIFAHTEQIYFLLE